MQTAEPANQRFAAPVLKQFELSHWSKSLSERLGNIIRFVSIIRFGPVLRFRTIFCPAALLLATALFLFAPLFFFAAILWLLLIVWPLVGIILRRSSCCNSTGQPSKQHTAATQERAPRKFPLGHNFIVRDGSNRIWIA